MRRACKPFRLCGRIDSSISLWINLRARDKIKLARYRDIDPSEIPVASLKGGGRAKVIAGTHAAGVLAGGNQVEVTAGPDGARFLLLAGRPLGEPVVQGPFVMNTREEIEQAIRDYQSGELTRVPATPATR